LRKAVPFFQPPNRCVAKSNLGKKLWFSDNSAIHALPSFNV
jgi:hypothetical protein